MAKDTTLPKPASNRATSYDVAARAGVDRSVVSVVLNGAKSSSRVSEEKRQRVMEAARELGYRPHLSAQAISSNRSMQVGVLLQNRPERRFAHPLAWEFVLGINEGLEAEGYIACLVRMTDMQDDGAFRARALRSQILDGVIAVGEISAGQDPVDLSSKISQLFPSAVWLDGNVWNEFNCVRRDERHAGETAVNVLVEYGYSEAVYIYRELGSSHFSSRVRYGGVQSTAWEKGVQLHECSIPPLTSLHDASARWLPLLKKGSVILTNDAYLAVDVMSYLSRTPWVLGRDLSLLSLDEYFHEPACHWAEVACITFDRFGMGRLAADMMCAQLNETGAQRPSQLTKSQFRPSSSLQPYEQ